MTPIEPFPSLRLSVLLPVWNERQHIGPAVAAFRALRYRPRELVLCAGGPDGSYAEAGRCAGDDIVVLQQHPGEGKQRALECCFAASRGEILFLTDADARLTDAAVEATVGPLLSGVVEAATGTRRPLVEQQGQALVAYQWAIELAGNARMPDPSPGLLGSNAALTRRAAEAIGGFHWAAPTGTDYSLACRLRGAGYPIRLVRESAMPVAFATTLRDYSRQRARWLRTPLLAGWSQGDMAVLRQSLQPVALGLLFLLLPWLPGPLRRPGRMSWCLLFLTGWLRRLAHVRAAPPEVRAVFRPRRWPLLGVYTAIDLVTWARAGIECVVPSWRGRW